MLCATRGVPRRRSGCPLATRRLLCVLALAAGIFTRMEIVEQSFLSLRCQGRVARPHFLFAQSGRAGHDASALATGVRVTGRAAAPRADVMRDAVPDGGGGDGVADAVAADPDDAEQCGDDCLLAIDDCLEDGCSVEAILQLSAKLQAAEDNFQPGSPGGDEALKEIRRLQESLRRLLAGTAADPGDAEKVLFEARSAFGAVPWR